MSSVVMLRRMAVAAASLTICSESDNDRTNVLKALGPILPSPVAHSALTLGFTSFVTPSMNNNSP